MTLVLALMPLFLLDWILRVLRILGFSLQMELKEPNLVPKNLKLFDSPGWCRIGMHYLFTKDEVEYSKAAISGIAWFGHMLLPYYKFGILNNSCVHIVRLFENKLVSIKVRQPRRKKLYFLWTMLYLLL